VCIGSAYVSKNDCGWDSNPHVRINYIETWQCALMFACRVMPHERFKKKRYAKSLQIALADSSAVRFQTLLLRLRSSIPSAVADFASACIYLCWKIVLCSSLCLSSWSQGFEFNAHLRLLIFLCTYVYKMCPFH